MATTYDRLTPAYRLEALPKGIDPENPYIMRWWTPEHDDAISQAIERHKWLWYWHIRDKLVSLTSDAALEIWRNSDPICSRWVWYNALTYFAYARAERNGLLTLIRPPMVKKCRMCELTFREDSLAVPLANRLGMDQLDFCAPCLSASLYSAGAEYATAEVIASYLRSLTATLKRIPPSDFGHNITDLHGLSRDDRLTVLEILRERPHLKRVTEIYGSWLNALIHAGVLEKDALRTARGIHCLANDGHVCYSFGEKTIDDLLYSLEIPHEKEAPYPTGNFRADFRVNGNFIEYFGLIGDPNYDAKIEVKQRICAAHEIRLVSIYPKDLLNISTLRQLILGSVAS